MNLRSKEIDDRPHVQELFKNLKTNLPALKDLLEKTNNEWNGEDGVYRFYHQSFKVFYLQNETTKIVKALSDLSPNLPFNDWFEEIILEGTGKQFQLSYNQHWLKETRPIVEAYFHAKHFLELAVKYGTLLKNPTNSLPTGWATFLYLYNLR